MGHHADDQTLTAMLVLHLHTTCNEETAGEEEQGVDGEVEEVISEMAGIGIGKGRE